jgi:hypothetical protein
LICIVGIAADAAFGWNPQRKEVWREIQNALNLTKFSEKQWAEVMSGGFSFPFLLF